MTDDRRLWFFDTLVTVHVSADEGNDSTSVVESIAPRGDSPPLHVHHREDEIFHILEGELRFRVGLEERTAGPGETLLAPKGIPHTYRVESDRGRWLVTTARGDFERFVRSLGRPAERDGLPDPAGPPSPAQAAALEAVCREHSIELVGPPLH